MLERRPGEHVVERVVVGRETFLFAHPELEVVGIAGDDARLHRLALELAGVDREEVEADEQLGAGLDGDEQVGHPRATADVGHPLAGQHHAVAPEEGHHLGRRLAGSGEVVATPVVVRGNRWRELLGLRGGRAGLDGDGDRDGDGRTALGPEARRRPPEEATRSQRAISWAGDDIVHRLGTWMMPASTGMAGSSMTANECNRSWTS